LAPLYQGPFKVLQKNPHSFRLQMGSRTDSVSVHRLKPAYVPPTVSPAQPPRRGRPPKVPLVSILKGSSLTFPTTHKKVVFNLSQQASEGPKRISHPPSRFSDFLL
jgi:hypothetical protein